MLVCLPEAFQTELFTYRKILKTMKDSEKKSSFSLWRVMCDETTDITGTAQLAMFVHRITAEFDAREELLSLEAMHGTTIGAYLCNRRFP